MRQRRFRAVLAPMLHFTPEDHLDNAEVYGVFGYELTCHDTRYNHQEADDPADHLFLACKLKEITKRDAASAP